MPKMILVIDDEESIRRSLEGVLSDEGYAVSTASDAKSAFDFLNQEIPDAILLDVWLTSSTGERQQEGLEILKRIKQTHPSIPILIMSGHGNIETAVKATKLGAYDFIEKPLSLEKTLLGLQNAFQWRDLSLENQILRSRVEKSNVMIGQSPPMLALKQAIQRAAATHAWVLIMGENGTGKELVAQSIHDQSPRANKPFIEVNCAAIPEELIESELFGHEKGAFTGAMQLKRGKFDLANGGTLFLDEIGDMSLKAQAKVLRILQEQRFERVGGTQTIQVDVRVIAATNKNLEDLIKQNEFRPDLYHRLNVISFRVPPLRERGSDIRLIAQHYLKEFSASHPESKRLNEQGYKVLESYPWPGNVRELKNTMERLAIFSNHSLIDVEQVLEALPHFSQQKTAPVTEVEKSLEGASSGTSLKDAKLSFEKAFILRNLKENDWNISKTAQTLNIERSHLHKKLKLFSIDSIHIKDQKGD